MPIYLYSCDKCGKEFEKYQKIEDAGQPNVCECGATAKQIIAPCGYGPWKPFYCDTQNRQFDTRESYQKYCHEKGLEGITAGEYRNIKQEAQYLADKEKAERMNPSSR